MLRFLGLYRPPIKAFFSLVGCEIGQNACYLSTSQSYIGANNQTVTGVKVRPGVREIVAPGWIQQGSQAKGFMDREERSPNQGQDGSGLFQLGQHRKPQRGKRTWGVIIWIWTATGMMEAILSGMKNLQRHLVLRAFPTSKLTTQGQVFSGKLGSV